MEEAEFGRTVQELTRDGPEFSLVVLLVGGTLAVLWLCWLWLARVAVYRSSDGARLVLGKSYEADSTVSGRVVGIHLTLGQQVHAQDVLVELDSQVEKRELAEDKVKMTTLRPQIAQLQAAIDAGEQAAQSASKTAEIELQQATVRWRQAVQTARISGNIAGRYEKARGVVPEIDLLKAGNRRAVMHLPHRRCSLISIEAAKPKPRKQAIVLRRSSNYAQIARN